MAEMKPETIEAYYKILLEVTGMMLANGATAGQAVGAMIRATAVTFHATKKEGVGLAEWQIACETGWKYAEAAKDKLATETK